MGKVLEVIGWLIIMATILVLLIVTSNSRNGFGALLILSWVVPSAIGGLIIAAFGRMLTEVIETKDLAKRQLWLLEEIAKSTRKPIELGRDDPR